MMIETTVTKIIKDEFILPKDLSDLDYGTVCRIYDDYGETETNEYFVLLSSGHVLWIWFDTQDNMWAVKHGDLMYIQERNSTIRLKEIKDAKLTIYLDI